MLRATTPSWMELQMKQFSEEWIIKKAVEGKMLGKKKCQQKKDFLAKLFRTTIDKVMIAIHRIIPKGRGGIL